LDSCNATKWGKLSQEATKVGVERNGSYVITEDIGAIKRMEKSTYKAKYNRPANKLRDFVGN
jgi:hypothetical protein